MVLLPTDEQIQMERHYDDETDKKIRKKSGKSETLRLHRNTKSITRAQGGTLVSLTPRRFTSELRCDCNNVQAEVQATRAIGCGRGRNPASWLDTQYVPMLSDSAPRPEADMLVRHG